jgi:HD superfamily phosphohydrolase
MKIYDSVHGFIHIDSLENGLIHTWPLQRLHYIHQMGITFLVYPGGTHRRFEHSLGVMELATRIYDEITKTDLDAIPNPGSSKHTYYRRILRLAALCHDIGHLPFSHTAEQRMLGKGGHEKWTANIINSPYLTSIWDALQKEDKGNVKEDVIKVALGGKGVALSPWERIVSSIITGDFFGADRIDYLIRDSQHTGLSYGLFDYHQLIEMLKIIPCSDTELILGIEENGLESCEALLLARHYMHKRLYQYATVKSYSFHMARFMETVFKDAIQDIESYLSLTDSEVLSALNKASRDPSHRGHFDAKCLLFRSSRFSAISLPAACKSSDLKQLQKKLSIGDHEIGWEMSERKEKHIGLTFPVLKEDGALETGDKLSNIYIPVEERSWIFVAPKYEPQIKKYCNAMIQGT